jgi:hypothetical protein
MSEKPSVNWNSIFNQQCHLSPFRILDDLFHLGSLENWPNAAGLNQLAENYKANDIPKFKCQSEFTQDSHYYEEIIFNEDAIPTRPNNWHDLFNGLIWLLFPKTKRLLNRQHVEEISHHGISPRTKKRNIITHFDECGVVLAYSKPDMIELLGSHQWLEFFYTNRSDWGNQISAFAFGHANLEMLLNPFIGLTGKWLAVEVPSEFFELPVKQQLRHLDYRLSSEIITDALYRQEKPLKPIPLLGIPNWSEDNQSVGFYSNKDYFRPLTKKTAKR